MTPALSDPFQRSTQPTSHPWAAPTIAAHHLRPIIGASDRSDGRYDPNQESQPDLTLDAAIRRHIRLVLDVHRGNKLRAARELGISRSTLYRLLAGGSISRPANVGQEEP